MENYQFGAASYDEEIIYGAQRPGYGSLQVTPGQVEKWIEFMRGKGIKRVCCLLNEKELNYYPHGLLDQYREAFGKENVLSAPIDDYHLVDEKVFHKKIMPFLLESVNNKPAVVHCAGGNGRTGHVLAGWLVYGRGFGAQQALNTVKELGRNPYEAIDEGNADINQLIRFLTPPSVEAK